MTAAFAAQYRDKLADSGLEPLTGIEQTNATFEEGVAASYRFMQDEGLSVSRGRAFEPYLTQRDDELEAITGERLTLPYGALNEPWYPEAVELVQSGELGLGTDGLESRSPRAKALSNRISPDYLKAIAVRENARLQHPDRILSDDDIAAKVQSDLGAKRASNQAVMNRSSGAAQFIGTAAGAVTDPAVLASLPFGAEWQGGRFLANAARAFGSEFLIGSASEALVQGEVYEFKKAIESPYTKADAIFNILAAGVGSGVVRAGAGAVIDGGLALRRAMGADGAREALSRAGIDPDIALRVADELETRAASRPAGVDLQTHSDAVDRAVNDVDAGRLAIPPEPAAPLSLSQRIASDPQLRSDLEELNLRSGWSQEGGQAFVRGTAIDKSDQEYFGRTTWIPREEWWTERPPGLTEAALDKAVKKALSGERLGAKQQEAVEWLAEIADMRRGNLDYLPEPADLWDEGLAGGVHEAHETAMVARASEIDEVGVERLAVQYEDDPAKFMAGIKGIIDAHEKGPTTASGRAPGFGPEEARAATGAIRDEAAAREVAGAPSYPVERSIAEAVAHQPPPKPKVKKGDGTPDDKPLPPPEDIPDVKIAVGEREDGTLETKSAQAALKELDDELRALDHIEACVRSAA